MAHLEDIKSLIMSSGIVGPGRGPIGPGVVASEAPKARQDFGFGDLAVMRIFESGAGAGAVRGSLVTWRYLRFF